MGLTTRNVSAGAGYIPQFLTLNRAGLETAYRGSWIVAAACDIPAEDMTRAGVDLDGMNDSADSDAVQAALRDMGVWQTLANGIRWGNLFGGACVVIMIKGQNPQTPLRIDRIPKGGLAGFRVLDRWVLQPDLTSIISDMGMDWGKPEFYTTVADNIAGLPAMRVHHTRVLRFEGYELPYYQRNQNNGWGLSVIERIWDRIQAFDSTFTGAAQLVYKAYLRTVQVKDLRQVVAAGGQIMQGVVAQFEFMRLMQSIEGLSILDADDKFEAHTYNFGGISDIMTQEMTQLCGALETPATRLFGTSPTGLGSNGNGELRDYYDAVARRQETKLRRPMTTILDVVHQSLFGTMPKVGFGFRFRPLWQMSDLDRSTIATNTVNAVSGAVNNIGMHQGTALKVLRDTSDVTGLFGQITDEEIADAEQLPPLSETAGLAHEGAALGVESQRQSVAEPDEPGKERED